MCIIIWNPNGSELDKEQIKSAFETNSHGFGMMYPENGNVKVIKGMHDFDYVWKLVENFKSRPYAMHFRYRTHGLTAAAQCHPFKILKNKLYMMHNGVLTDFATSEKKSDSQMFAQAVRKQVYRGKLDPKLIFDPRVIKSLGKDIAGNKLLFMDGNGQVAIVNEKSGSWVDGVWYSNLYSLRRRWTTATYKYGTPTSYTSYSSVGGSSAGFKGAPAGFQRALDDDDDEYLQAWMEHEAEKARVSGDEDNWKDVRDEIRAALASSDDLVTPVERRLPAVDATGKPYLNWLEVNHHYHNRYGE